MTFSGFSFWYLPLKKATKTSKKTRISMVKEYVLINCYRPTPGWVWIFAGRVCANGFNLVTPWRNSNSNIPWWGVGNRTPCPWWMSSTENTSLRKTKIKTHHWKSEELSIYAEGYICDLKFATGKLSDNQRLRHVVELLFLWDAPGI